MKKLRRLNQEKERWMDGGTPWRAEILCLLMGSLTRRRHPFLYIIKSLWSKITIYRRVLFVSNLKKSHIIYQIISVTIIHIVIIHELVDSAKYKLEINFSDLGHECFPLSQNMARGQISFELIPKGW